jgi:class 3 adenylate cyclase/tetratricopeptide (TPR) repeat protein
MLQPVFVRFREPELSKLVVTILHRSEYVVVGAKQDVKAMLLDAPGLVAPARRFSSEPPAHLVDRDVVEAGLIAREVIDRCQRRGAAAHEGKLYFSSMFLRNFHRPHASSCKPRAVRIAGLRAALPSFTPRGTGARRRRHSVSSCVSSCVIHASFMRGSVNAIPTRFDHHPLTVSPASRRKVSGSCLWLDIAGFSALTDRASSEGATGIEKLSDTVSRLYRQIDEAVRASAGQVLFFAGDGALCFWQVDSTRLLPDSALAAASTALALRSALTQQRYGDFSPVLRQIVLSGRWSVRGLGREGGAPLNVFSGAGLYGLSPLTKICASGQIVLSARSARLLGARVSVKALAPGASVLGGIEPSALRSLPSSTAENASIAPAEALLAALLDTAVARRSLLGLPAELRRASVLYVSTQPCCTTSLRALQRLTQKVQQAATQEGGYLCQMVHDDKGIVFLVVFGLPGHSRGEEALRAVRCAMQVTEGAGQRHMPIGVAVGTGTVFCGAAGNRERQQYCIIGNPVIRAARLSALQSGAALVDSETFRQAVRRFQFEPAGSVALKGMGQPVTAYRVTRLRRELAIPHALVGREPETLALRALVAEMAPGASSQTLIVRGDLGVGKTALLSQLPRFAAELCLDCFATAADALDEHAPYLGFRPLLQAMFGNDSEFRARLEQALACIEGGTELCAVLNPLLLWEFAPSIRVQQMSPAARRETRLGLVTALLELELGRRARIIVVDDAQWLDASSLELIQHLQTRWSGSLWVLAERLAAGHVDRTASFPDAETWILSPLSADGIELLVRSLTQAERVARDVLAAMERTSQGNPLLTIELAHDLTAAHRVSVRNGVFAFHDELQRDTSVVPATLEDLIQSRCDRLSSTARQVLRAASVLGASFELDVIRQVLQPTLDASDFDIGLRELLAESVIVHDEVCRFRHLSIQTVIYGSLLPSDQSSLHARAAQALEAAHLGRARWVAARLAHHWQASGDLTRAAHFSALAAEHALEGYAHADAIHLFTQALAQASVLRGAGGIDAERARWSASLAQALYSESRYAESRQAYERALAWTGCPDPGRGPLELTVNALRVAAGALAEKLGARRRQRVDEQTRDRHLAAMHVMHASGALDVWEGKLFSAANKSLVGYRLSRRVGTARESSEAVADLGYMLGSTPARRYAYSLLAQGRDLADATGDLEARTSTRVLIGMHLTAAGRSPEADTPLREARELADRLGSGLWRHRAAFGRGEALFFSGRLGEAEGLFGEAARLASAAEPPVEGFAHCMQALAMAGSGRVEEAVSLAAGARGASLTRGPCLVLQRFSSHGICADLLARAGRWDEALEAAEFTFRLAEAESEVSVFLAGLHGHSGLVTCFLAALQRVIEQRTELAGWSRQRLSRHLSVSLRRLQRLGGLYRAAASRVQLLAGNVHALERRSARAERCYVRAVAAARAMDQEFELALASRSLAGVRRLD